MEILYLHKKGNFLGKNINSKKLIDKFYKKKNPLYDEKIENIISTFDEISKYWISNQFKQKKIFINNSLGFIIPWLKSRNSIDILNLNFVNYKQLDNPSIYIDPKILMFARPQGTALHWLAGNVPVISLIG